MKRLETARYIEIQKEFVDRKPVTSYRLPQLGREAFKLYRERTSEFFEELPE